MNPVIISIKQGTVLGAGNVPVAVLNVTWTAGPYGPFTTQSTWEALNGGTLLSDLQAKARKLGNLPTPPQSA